MNPKWKLTAYAVLLILNAWFGRSFYSNYSAVTKAAADTGADAPAVTPITRSNANNPATTNAVTNVLAAPDPNVSAAPNTNTAATPDTNVSATPDTNVSTTPDTNAAATPDTNVSATPNTNGAATPDTNAPPTQSNAPAPAREAAKKPARAVDLTLARGAMIAYLAAFVGTVIGLGLLIAHDVTQFAGSKVVEYVIGDVGEALRDPEYERAEAEWANGKYLDAIQLMRNFLQKNPHQIHAALRIAEIYEKDLKNLLAAALEYEEVLKHKLPAEQWGWAAIHLCNLYSRLNKSDQALALLRRIVDQYPKTGAAKKARVRLGLAEPELEVAEQEVNAEEELESTEQTTVITMEARPPELEPRTKAPPPPPAPPTPPKPPKPSLPPGFRPKE
jgi:TolA-binding protein